MAAKKRTLIEPHPGDKRYIRRDDLGRIVESDDVSRSLSMDIRRSAKTVSKPGQGDKGDRAPAKKAPEKKSVKRAAPAKKAAVKKSPAKKSPAKKAPARKAAAKKSAARKR